MSKVKYIIEVDKDDIDVFLNQMNEHYIINQYNGEIAVCGRVLLSTFRTAIPITESDDAVSRQAVRNAINNLYGECNAISYTDEIRMLINILPPVLPKCEQGEWIKDDFTGLIKCSRCKNDAPISTVSGTQYESDFCQSCGAEMR